MDLDGLVKNKVLIYACIQRMKIKKTHRIKDIDREREREIQRDTDKYIETKLIQTDDKDKETMLEIQRNRKIDRHINIEKKRQRKLNSDRYSETLTEQMIFHFCYLLNY